MPSRPSLVDELRAALARRRDPGLEALIEQADAEARAEVVARLKELLVEDLLERALRALPAPPAEGRLSLVGVVHASASTGTETVQVGDLAAIVSELEPGELDDPHVLERHVRAHNDALLAALESGAVVPIRFGTLFASTADVAGWLERHESALLAELDRLTDTMEWALRVLEPVPEPESVSVGSAETYLERRLEEGEAVARRRQELAESTAAWHERLAAHAEDAVILGGRALLDAAYLVRRSRQTEFDAVLAEVIEELDAHELQSRLTGPWPPFSFVDALR